MGRKKIVNGKNSKKEFLQKSLGAISVERE